MFWRIWTTLSLLLFTGVAVAQPAGEPITVNLTSGTATLTLDFTGQEYELVLYSTATDEPDTSRTFSYTLSGAPTAARPVPLRRSQNIAVSDRDRFETLLRREERELAKRLRQTGGWQPSLSKAAQPDQATRSFTFSKFGGVTSDRTVEATQVASTSRAIGYLDNNLSGAEVTITTADIQAMLERFSTNNYPIITSNFGDPSDVDGNGKVIFLFTPLVDQVGGVAGFYSSRSLFATNRGGNGNQADMMFIGLSHSLDFYEPLLAHEFQHLVNYNQHVLVHDGQSEDSWLNEALSHYTEDLVGGHITGDLPRLYGPFLQNPAANSLIGDAGLNNSIRGAAYLFLRGLIEQFGTNIASSLVKTPRAGIPNVEAQTGRNFKDLYRTYTARLFLSGNGLNTSPVYNYTFSFLTEPTTGARSIPMPAETGFSVNGPSVTGRVKPLAPTYLRLMGNGTNNTVTLQAETAGQFQGFLIPIPADFRPQTGLARDYFPRLTFDGPLQGLFTAGSATEISGTVSDPSIDRILFRFEPLGGQQDTLRFFADVQSGRFSRSILFDPSQAGTYTLAFYMGIQDQSLPFLGRFSPVTVTPGSGQVLIPVDFFSGFTLNQPLPAYHKAGTGASLSGRVTDTSIETLLMRLTSEDGNTVIRIGTDVSGGTFRKGFVFFPAQAGTYTLDFFGGPSGGSLPHLGNYSPFVVTSSGNEPVFIPVDALDGLVLDTPIPASYFSGQTVHISGTLTNPANTQVLFRFDPLDSGDPIRFFTDVSGGRFAQTLDFSAAPTGQYDLVVFGGPAGQSLPHLDTFSPISILAPQPRIRVSAESLHFGEITVGNSGTATFIVHNTGSETLSVSGLSSNTSGFTASPNTFSVASGDSTVVTLTFTPSSAGEVAGTLLISSNDTTTPTVRIALSGTVVAASVTTSADFNDDGQVNFTDFLIFASAFGTSSGDPGYHTRFDLDLDGHIAFSDFVLFVKSYGQ